MVLIVLALLPLQGFEERKLATLGERAELIQAVTTPDGRTVAFTEEVDGECKVRRGAWTSKAFATVFGLRISDDGRQVFYVARDGEGRQSLYRNDEVLLEMKDGWRPVGFDPLVSSDGRVVIMAVEKSEKGEGAIAVNGRIEKTYPGMVVFPSMSRDGKVICFAWKRKDDKWHLVLDGKVGPECDMFTPPAVSAAGKTVAYALQNGEKWTLTIGDSTSTVEGGPHRIFLSPDGKSHGFVMEDKSLPSSEPRRFSVQVGETKGAERFTIIVPPIFSPDQKHWACKALRSQKGWIVTDQGVIESAFETGEPVFSSDGRSIGYWTLVGRDLVWKVLLVAK